MTVQAKGWAPCTLADVVTLKTGPFGSAVHQSDYVNGGTPLINPTHIKSGRLVPDFSVTVTPEKLTELNEYKLVEGDVVMGRRGEMGRCAVAPKTAEGWLCGTGSVIARPTNAITPHFLQRFLSSPETVRALNGDSVGSTMVNLNQKILLSLSIDLPPLAEQKRIADKLDTVLTRVDAVNTRLARVAPLLKRFRQSVLAAATSGRLTEDWRESRSLAPWGATEVQNVAHVGTGSTPLRSNPDFFAEFGTPWVTSSATGTQFVTGAVEFVTPTAIAAHRLKVYPPGTLLVAMYGEGKTRGQVAELAIPATINQACAAVVVDERLMLKGFLKLVLQANYFQMRVLAEGGNQPNLNLSKVKTFPLPEPTHEEQTEIVRRVETLFAFADRLEARLALAQTAATRLTPALLAKAFRGELVPQDPNDDPAAELLRRLQAERATAPKASAGRGRKAVVQS